MRCVLADGTEGWGEGVPREYVTGETAESALALLRRSDFACAVGAVRRFRRGGIARGTTPHGPTARRRPRHPRQRRPLCRRTGHPRRLRPTFRRTAVGGHAAHRPEPVPAPAVGALQRRDHLVGRAKAQARRLGLSALRLPAGEGQGRHRRAGRRGPTASRFAAGLAGGSNCGSTPTKHGRPHRPPSVFESSSRSASPASSSRCRTREVASLAEIRQQITTPVMLDESLCSMIDAERAVAGGLVRSVQSAAVEVRRPHPDTAAGRIRPPERHRLPTRLPGRRDGHPVRGRPAFRRERGRADGRRRLVRPAPGSSRSSREDITFGRGGWAPPCPAPALASPSTPRKSTGSRSPRRRCLAELRPIAFPFTASDGYVWYYCRFLPAGGTGEVVDSARHPESRRVVSPNRADELAAAGYGVSFLDRRGCGSNERDRGDAPSFRRLLDDVAEFMAAVAAAPVSGRHLLGRQAGRRLAAPSSRTDRRPCPDRARPLPASSGRRSASVCEFIVCALRRHRGGDSRSRSTSPELFTANRERQEFIRNDPLARTKPSARLLFESARMDVYLRFAARHVTMPVLLLLAGRTGSSTTRPPGGFCERFPTPDRTVIEYADAHHTLEFEPDGPPDSR